jgi:hypothetical protein
MIIPWAGMPHLRRTLAPTLGLLTVLSFALPGHAQGCSQCREAVGQTPARTQTAYRRAIVVLAIAGGGVFTAGLVVLKRFR